MDTETPGASGAITLSKADPKIAEMFSECKPGDEITLTLEYGEKSVGLKVTVGTDDEQTFTAQVTEVSEPEAEEAGEEPATENEPDEDDAGAGAASAAGSGSPMDYIKSQRK